ncbi:MAG: ECF-type sigma factor [Planctomycetota bacterium]
MRDRPDHSEAGFDAGELDPQVYSELRRIASGYLGRERAEHTLEATALVHEAWIRVARQHDAEVRNRAHFRALASQAMRRILVDHARGKQAQKRSADAERITISAVAGDQNEPGLDVLELDDALHKLERVSARQAKVVELRFFGGMSIDETAQALDVAPRTVDGDWRVARAWLSRELDRQA